jgi:hypothetical protein
VLAALHRSATGRFVRVLLGAVCLAGTPLPASARPNVFDPNLEIQFLSGQPAIEASCV